MSRSWYCIPCMQSHPAEVVRCTLCGRTRNQASDPKRWKRFFMSGKK